MGNMDAKQIRLFVAVLVAVVLLVAFRFGFTPLSEKVDEVNAENEVLTTELSALQADAANEEQLKADLETTTVGLDLITARYPVAVTPEKSIMFIKALEESTGSVVSNISFNPSENIYSSSFVSETGDNIIGYVSPLNISYQTSYKGLKDMMNFINTYAERSNVRDFTAAYNQETGLLTGTMVINRYSVTGLGKEYEAPAIGDVAISTGNIFNSIE